MATSVKITNLSRTSQTVILDHPRAPKQRMQIQTTEHDRKTGAVRRRPLVKNLPKSLTILAGQTVENLDGWVGVTPDVKRLEAAKVLRVERTTTSESTAETKTAKPAKRPAKTTTKDSADSGE